MMEIELKAHVRNMSEVERQVASFATWMREFDKFDSYWHGPDWRFVRGTKGFRVRSDDGKTIVNFKTKHNDSGIEINRETEFEVSDRATFLALIERIGCEPFYEKRKKGVAYEYDGFLIELLQVEGLGHFIEIEQILESDDPAGIALAQGGLRSILNRAGVAETEIEARSYSELIITANL